MKLRFSSLGLLLLLSLLCALPAQAADPIRIMAVGDSITAGYTDNRDGWTEPFGFGYRAPLYTRLTDAGYNFEFVGASGEPWNHETAPTEAQVWDGIDLRDVGQDNHRGYGGKNVSYVASNIVNWMNEDDPDVILLMIGINDIAQYSTGEPTTVQSNLNSLVNTIVTTRPEVNLIVAQITPYAHYTDSIVQYNNYIANTLVPAYSLFGYNVTTVNQYDNLLTDGVIDPTLFSNGINHETAVSYDRMAQTWFEGIETLGYETDPVDPNPQDPGTVFNGGFEDPTYTAPHHDYAGGIDGSGWTRTGRAGIDSGNPYGGSVLNCGPYSGSQMAFIQGDLNNTANPAPDGVSSISQDITGLTIGETYTLSFQAKGMDGFDGVNPFSVSFGGVDLTFDGITLLEPGTVFEYYVSDPIVASAETMNLKFYDEGYVPGPQVSWIDDIQLTVDTTAPEASLVQNGYFESPALADPTHNYGTISTLSTEWTFEGRAGIDCGNAYGANAANCAPYEGSQMAFLQGDTDNTINPSADGVSKMEQEISGLEVGESYVLSFAAMGMDGYDGVDPFHVSIDGEDLFGLITPTLEYQIFSAEFTATSETMSLLFYDETYADKGRVTWIDAVTILTSDTPKIPGDANNDGKVDGSDVTILAGNWQKGVSDGQTASWSEGDFNGDGKVDGSDVTILAGNWQYGVNATTASVPEPSTMALLLLLAGMASMVRTIRRK